MARGRTDLPTVSRDFLTSQLAMVRILAKNSNNPSFLSFYVRFNTYNTIQIKEMGKLREYT